MLVWALDLQVLTLGVDLDLREHEERGREMRQWEFADRTKTGSPLAGWFRRGAKPAASSPARELNLEQEQSNAQQRRLRQRLLFLGFCGL
jgi:hypothetical protein